MALSTLARTARVLLGVHVVAVTLFSLLLHRQSPSAHDWELDLEPLSPLELSTSELAGRYGGKDSWLVLDAAGTYEYRGDFHMAGYGCMVSYAASTGTWERDHAGIFLRSADEAEELLRLAIWRTERTLCLTTRPGSVLVDEILRRYDERVHEPPSPRVPPGVIPR